MSSDISKAMINGLREEIAQLKDQVEAYKSMSLVLLDCLADIEDVQKAAQEKLFFAYKQSDEQRHTKNRRSR